MTCFFSKGFETIKKDPDIPFSFPDRGKTDDIEADKARYQEALETHDEETGLRLIPKGLEIATCPIAEIPRNDVRDTITLASEDEISLEVARRKNPENCAHLLGKSLLEAKEEIAWMGKPLAPQSIEALANLLKDYEPLKFDENLFVEREVYQIG